MPGDVTKGDLQVVAEHEVYGCWTTVSGDVPSEIGHDAAERLDVAQRQLRQNIDWAGVDCPERKKAEWI